MDLAQLETEINAVWDARDTVTVDTKGAVRDAVASALDMLDSGSARVAEPLGDHQWQVNQWLKKAVLLSFRLNDMQSIPSGTIFQGLASPCGGIKLHQNSVAGMMHVFEPLASGLFQAALCGILLILHQMLS